MARFGRRLGALLLDWGLRAAVSRGLLHGNEWTTLGIFALLQALVVAAFNGGPGHLALGMRVTRRGRREPPARCARWDARCCSRWPSRR